MKLLLTEITPQIDEISFIDQRNQPFLQSLFHTQPTFHAHPESELVYIVEGYGKRIIWDTVESFQSGDMVFIGPKVPHLWLSDDDFYKENSGLVSKVVVAYFNSDRFREVFESVKEYSDIRDMIQQATEGIKIYGETRRIIADKMISLCSKSGFDRIQGLLRIMHIISTSKDKSTIVNSVTEIPSQYSDKLMDVIRFVKENFHNHISLRQVSAIACMTEPSFCRYFRRKTKKRFSKYLSDQRISHACKLLIQTNKSIAEISDLCGYNSSSHLCRNFKEHIGQTPHQYRINIKMK